MNESFGIFEWETLIGKNPPKNLISFDEKFH